MLNIHRNKQNKFRSAKVYIVFMHNKAKNKALISSNFFIKFSDRIYLTLYFSLDTVK